MNEKLSAYLDAAFARYKKQGNIVEIKEEILANLQDKYAALKEQGKSDEEAYQETIDSLGDIDEFIAEQGKAEAKSSGLNHMIFKKMVNADLSGFQLQDGSFRYSAMRGIDFRNSDLTGSIFSTVDLRHAKFDGANLSRVEIKKAALNGASFEGGTLNQTLFDKVALNGASFKGGTLNQAVFDKVALNGIDFSGVTMDGVRFKAAALNGASFEGAVLHDVVFEYTTSLRRANFNGATMDKVTYATLLGKDVDLGRVVVE